MKQRLLLWGERYLYAPTIFDRALSILLLPLSFIYCIAVFIRFKLSKPIDFNIPIISIGNLTVGGNGKTPITISLAKHFAKPAIILRGYGRESSGMIVVKDFGNILCDVYKSGDEAMLYAMKLPHAVVVVSEDRAIAIEKAKEMGCSVVFLDDGYSKHHIKKLDFIISSDRTNSFCLPSGAYREKLWWGKEAIELSEDRDFFRRVAIVDESEKMALVTAIAKPQRLDRYLPSVVAKYYFSDHHYFRRNELEEILESSGANSLLVTTKDLVKIAQFDLPISVMDLEIDIDERIVTIAKRYAYEKDD